MSQDAKKLWWRAEEGEAHAPLFDLVRAIESEQGGLYERLYRYGTLYDPHDPLFRSSWWTSGSTSSPDGFVNENIVKGAIDTATSMIARMRPRIRCQTDGADWSQQRRARRLEQYIEGVFKKSRVYDVMPDVFRDAAVSGVGVVKVLPNGDKLQIERVIWDEIIVDNRACRSAPPREIHHRKIVDRAELAERYPDAEELIEKAGRDMTAGTLRAWPNLGRLQRDEVVVIETYRLGTNDMPGRHVIALDNGTILDEEWEGDWFPYVVYRWVSRVSGFYGRGISEDLAGIQRRINRMNQQFDRWLDQHARPKMFVAQADAKMALEISNGAGDIYPYKIRAPEWKVPAAIGGENYTRLNDLKQSAFEMIGISRLSAQALKPAGLESAVALREYNDIETQRFAIQAQAYESCFIQLARVVVGWSKLMAADGNAPVVTTKAYGRQRVIEWDDVDLDDVPYTMDLDAASALSRTPAGRQQTIVEWAQAGIVTLDQARSLIRHPDLESAMSVYTAAMDDVDAAIERTRDGENETPEPYQNLQMGIWRYQMAYLRDRRDGAPESVLEDMRTWIVLAQHILQSGQAAANQGAMAGGNAVTPQAALAPQAMQLAAA